MQHAKTCLAGPDNKEHAYSFDPDTVALSDAFPPP